MSKNGKNQKEERGKNGKDKKKESLLHMRTKKWIKAILFFLVATIIALSFLQKSGILGNALVVILNYVFGDAKITVVTIILSLFVAGTVFLKSNKKVNLLSILLAVFITIIGISGLSGNQNLNIIYIGMFGWIAKLLMGGFGLLVSNIIFAVVILIGLFIFLQFVWEYHPDVKEEKGPLLLPGQKSFDSPNLKISGIQSEKLEVPKSSLFSAKGGSASGGKNADKTEIVPIAVNQSLPKQKGKYALPPIDLLSKNETVPTSGNIKENSLIIKKTLENFGIPVEMTEVNVGPAVTQYAFKPAEGVKLSKITTLGNNLALALAAHPIRIEAPIPGKSLVGIEVPNKIRAMVTLRNLVADPKYQNSPDHLMLALGKDVSGQPMYTDLAEQPHMLVAGATGTGKTIFLNALVLSLLYKSTPENLRLIMVDPKRVEFQNYNNIPHLLCPVINDATRTINALQWLAKEMERRFEVFAEANARNIKSYNANKKVIDSGSVLPYIVLIVDELPDFICAVRAKCTLTDA